MSDTGKIILAVLGTGLLLGLGYAAFSGPAAAAPPAFQPDAPPGSLPPATDAGAEGVRQGGTILNTFLHDFLTNRDRQAQRDADATARREDREGSLGSGKSGGYDGPYTAADAARDISAKNGSVSPR